MVLEMEMVGLAKYFHFLWSKIKMQSCYLHALVTIPRRELVPLKHVEFLPLSGTRVLVILVLDDHDVQNRVIHTTEPFTEIQLREATNFLNAHFSGHSVQRIRKQLRLGCKAGRGFGPEDQ